MATGNQNQSSLLSGDNILSSVYNRGKNAVETLSVSTDMAKEKLKEKKEKEKQKQREGVKLELYEKSLDAKDTVQSQSYKSQGRNGEVADMIRAYRKSWGKDDNGKDDTTVISEYISHNPNSQRAINDYINGNGSATTLMYEMGWNKTPQNTGVSKSEGGKLQTVKNVVGGAYDSVTGLAELGAKGLANAVGWTAKKLGADEQKVDELVQGYKDSLKDLKGSAMGADEESLVYKATNTVGDLAQLTTGEGIIKGGAKAVAKSTPKIAKAMESIGAIGKAIEETPILGKLAKFTGKNVARGTQGAADTILYNAINGEGTSTDQMDEGALINMALGSAGNTLSGIYKKAKGGISKMMTSGLVNKGTLEATNNYLMQAEGASIPDIQATGKWLAERGFKGDKATLRNDLNNWVQTFRQAKREILDQSATKVESKAAHEALDALVKKYDNQPGLSDALEGIKKMQAKDTYTIKELDEIKGIIDDSGLHIFNKNGTEADKIAAGGWNNLRRQIKEQIENTAEQEGLGNIKAINKEIQVAKALEEGIYQKELSSEVGDLMAKLNPRSLAYNTMISAATTTKNATTVANILARASGMSKKDLSSLLGKKGKFSEDLLNKMFNGDEKKINKVIDEINNAISDKMPFKETAEKMPYEYAGSPLQKALLFETEEGIHK